MNQTHSAYQVYKGLQKPLIFRGFKGKFIYIGFSFVIGGLILCIVISSLVSFLVGGLTLIVVMFGGLALTAQMQKKGLHNKRLDSGTFIVTNIFSHNI